MKLLHFIITSLTLIILLVYSCRKDPSRRDPINDNLPPVANAGRDTTIILPVDSVKLNGNVSSDPDGTIKSYWWSKISGPASALLVNPDSVNSLIKNLTTGVYQVELKVTDNRGLFARDTLTITVDSVATANHPPIARAGSDQTLLASPDFLFDGIAAMLDGSQSLDPDSNINSYQWLKISGARSSHILNADSSRAEAWFSEYGSYQFELNVTDSKGLSSKDTLTVTVEMTDTVNQPPIANAGVDQLIFLPLNSITLDGKLSHDPNNNIINFRWTKVSGPSTFNILNGSAMQTQVTSLTEGVYQFELKVTDATTLSSVDTVRVIVRTCGTNRPGVTANLTPFGKMPNPRNGFAVAAAANKIVFAGGTSTDEPYGSSKVDIYDLGTGTWSTAKLSVPRSSITAIAAGDKILFAGGFSGEIGDLENYHSTVDIYDAAANSWSFTSMNMRRYGMSATTVGSKVLFAGGEAQFINNNSVSYGWSNTVEVYDLSANAWSTSYLSEARTGIASVTLNNKVYLAGGMLSSFKFSDKVEVFDNASNTWSTTRLSGPRLINQGGVAIKNKIFWAGGYDELGATCKVEILDVLSQTMEFENLSSGDYVKAFSVNDKIIFCGSYGKNLDIYDIGAKTWSIIVLPNLAIPLLAVNNTIYLTDPNDTSQMIWKLDF